MNVDDVQIRVNMPKQWIVENKILTLTEMFDNYLSDGEKITVKALEADVINKEGLRIYILVGYELTTNSGVQVTANLRVNIED